MFKISKKLILISVLTVLFILPLVISAVEFNVSGTGMPQQNVNLIPQIVRLINNIFNYLIWPFVVTVVIILFIMAGFAFITAAGEPGKLDTAKKFLIWALIGVVVIIVAFSIVITIQSILNLSSTPPNP